MSGVVAQRFGRQVARVETALVFLPVAVVLVFLVELFLVYAGVRIKGMGIDAQELAGNWSAVQPSFSTASPGPTWPGNHGSRHPAPLPDRESCGMMVSATSRPGLSLSPQKRHHRRINKRRQVVAVPAAAAAGQ
jgi:hypothetical protein